MDSYLISLLSRIQTVKLDPFMMHRELGRIRLLYHISFRRLLGVERVLLSPDPTLRRLWRSIHLPLVTLVTPLVAPLVSLVPVSRRRR